MNVQNRGHTIGMKRKILVFQHVPREHTSRIQMYARENNIELTTVRLWEPYTMPDVLEYEGLIVLGGPMNVPKGFPSMNDELEVIASSINKIPILGICLGGQLIAHALGANVKENIVDGRVLKEIGHYVVELTPAGKKSRLFKGFPDDFVVLQWHGDTFDIPKGTERLAHGGICENQAFSYGEGTHAIQFHLEHTPFALAHQIDEFGEWARTDFEFDDRVILEEAHNLAPAMTEHCYRLLDNVFS